MCNTYTSREGHGEAIKAFSEKGAELNALNQSDRTPLHLAVQNGHTEAITTLINAGADNAKTYSRIYCKF